MDSRLATAALAAAVALLASAPPSLAQGGGTGDRGPKKTLLATLSLKDGGSVRFHEPVPGEIAVVTLSPAKRDGGGQKERTFGGVSGKQLDRLKPLDQYRLLSGGRQPPAALVAAQRRADQARRAPAAGPTGRHHPPVSRSPAPLADKRAEGRLAASSSWDSGAWFQTYHCPTFQGRPQGYCYLWRTGDAGSEWVQDTELTSRVYPYQGGVSHRIEYRTCGWFSCSWTTSVTQDVSQDWLSEIRSYGPDRYRRAKVYNAQGDGYHWRVVGVELGQIQQP